MTGFEAWNLPENPSQLLVESCRDEPPEPLTEANCEVTWLIASCDTEGIHDFVGGLMQYKPDVVLFTGQSGIRPQIAFERYARNLRDFAIPDSAGRILRGVQIRPGGPTTYSQTLANLNRIIATLNDHGVAATLSSSAGDHLCNQILFEGLDTCAKEGLRTACGLMHIPLVAGQVMDPGGAGTGYTMPLGTLRLGLALALRELANS